MFRTLSSVLVLMAGALAAFGGHPKVAKDLATVDPGSTVDVIIQFKHDLKEEHLDKVRRNGGRAKEI